MEQLLLPALIGIVASIWSNKLSVPENVAEFINFGRRTGVLENTFSVAAKLVDITLGEKIWSLTSFVRSVTLSVAWFGICVAAMLATTSIDWIDNYIGRLVNYQPWSIGVLGLLLLAEFVYVSKTRFILRRITKSKPKVLTVTWFFVLDLLSTYWIFVLGVTTVLWVSTYIAQIIVGPQITITHVETVTELGWNIANNGLIIARDLPVNMYQNGFPTIMVKVCSLLWGHVASLFHDYYILHIVARRGAEDVSVVSIPFTTIAASTLATTVWISGSWITAVLLSIFYRAIFFSGVAIKVANSVRVAGVGFTTMMVIVIVWLVRQYV